MNDLQIIKPQEIVKADLEKFASDYAQLVVTEETFDESKKARAVIREKRYSIQKIEKDNNSKLNDLKKQNKDNAETLIAILEPIENRIDAGIKEIEGKKEVIRKQKEEAEQQRIQGRIKRLFDCGMNFNGVDYSLGDVRINSLEVKEKDDDEFLQIEAFAKEEKKKLDEVKSKEEAAKKEESERLEKQRQEQEAEAKRLEAERNQIAAEQAKKEAEIKAEQDRVAKEQKDKQDALDKERKAMEEEKRKIAQQKIDARKNEMTAIGLKFQIATNSFVFDDQIMVSLDAIESMSDQVFAENLQKSKAIMDEAKKVLEGLERQKIEADKQAAIEKAKKEEAARIEAERKAEEEVKAKVVADSKAKAELASDKEKMSIFISSLNGITFPAMTSNEGKKLMAEAADSIERIKYNINQKIK